MAKLELEKCNSLLDNDFSLITVKENKQPNIAWKKYQTQKPTKTEFERNWHLQTSDAVGLVTGYNKVEVIDVDLKVFDSELKRTEFWTEYLSFLNDNIENFQSKFIIVKTKNNGYHILYRCNFTQGNTKLAKLENIKEAVIETRGIGGYVFIYSDFVQGNGYNDIKLISNEDREILWRCSKTYNFVPKSINTGISISEETNGLTPWDDYNERVSIFDVIGSDFESIKKLKDKTIIKRFGAESAHSGYVYDNSNSMFLFTTATIYPHEKLITPFEAYAIKNCNGDYTKAGGDLYKAGYGARGSYDYQPKKRAKIETFDIEEKTPDTVSFPKGIFPSFLQNFIDEVSINAGFSKDFLSCSVMSTFATILGQSVELRINNTWSTNPIFWFAIVGTPGSKKSHPVKFAIKPLREIDKASKGVYDEQKAVWDTFTDLGEKEKKEFVNEFGKITKPNYKQLIVKDATSEALFHVHENNKRGILLYKDELIGWINAMGQYKGGKGDEMEKFLSMFDGDELVINRVTKEPLMMERTCMNLIGTIQPEVISKIPEDNGLIYRFLFTNADTEIKYFNPNEISIEKIFEYSRIIKEIDQEIRKNDGEVITYEMTKSAKDVFRKIDKYLVDIQISDETEPVILMYCEKLKSYYPRFALLLAIINSLDDQNNYAEVSESHMNYAFKLVKYFLQTARIMFFNKKKNKEVNDISKLLNGKTTAEKILSLNEKKISKAQIARELEVSRQYVYEVLKKAESVK